MAMYNALISKEGDTFIARCLEIGTTSQGRSDEEALKNLKEATELYLEEFPEKKSGKVLLKKFEVQLAKTKGCIC